MGTKLACLIEMKKVRFVSRLALAMLILMGITVIAKASLLNVTSVDVSYLRCEYLVDPPGIDVAKPRLSWIINSSRRGEKQMGYQILVASSREMLAANKGDLWDTGQVPSDRTSQIAYQGKPLVSRQRCYWKVRIWDQDGFSAWSPPALWEMGLLDPADWKAKWISAGQPPTDNGAPLVIHRAIYQATDGDGQADVTDVVASSVKDDTVSIKVSNDSFGHDPAPNHTKKLMVDYALNGHAHTLEVGENQELAIPPSSSGVPWLRKNFDLSRPISRAVLYATALGLYQIDINGHRVGDHIFEPDWTDYRKRVRYQVYDVTSLVRQGGNAIGALLANGWYSGHIGNGGYQMFGKVPALFAQLEITYGDGSTEVIATDDSWKSHSSPILTSDIMLGETYDARKEIEGWDEPDLDESKWLPVIVRDKPAIALGAQVSPPVRELCELKPRKETEPQPGHWTYDLGQNMVGVVRLAISAPAGTEVILRHAEMLKSDGTLYTNNLRGAPSIDRYVCKGTGLEIWQPRFTFHGFRYVEVSGLPTDPGINAVTGIVLGTATPQTGEFTCSDPRLTQLESNIQWGQRGNYLSIPTDCPQRDERMGWMGDAEVFIPTATYNTDVAAFFTKWLVDVDDGQATNGAFSDVSPNDSPGHVGAPGWGDAGVVCPWTIYQAYGDERVLEKHLPAMIRWVEFMRRNSDGLIRDRERGSDYGDWLSVDADTPKELIGTAYFAYSTHLVAESCAAVGWTNDAAEYERLFEDIKTAFDKKYVTADGHIEGNTQTAYALALKFDLLPDNLRANAAQYLADDVRNKGWHLSTGFLGVGKLLPMLAENGQSETAYRVLLQDTYPSWLFPVEHGATTIWERWDGWTPDKGFEDPGMNSFNHYSLGSCGEFLMGYIGGIRAASPGYNAILIDPVIGKGLTWAKTSYSSIHGRIATYWKVDGDKLTLKVTVPANTSATVCIPATDPKMVTESGKPIGDAQGVTYVKQENGHVYLDIGSGTYQFRSLIPNS
jgi:alpha-L-rhamnosidase